MSGLKPLAYGYMRIFCDVTEEQVCVMEQRIVRLAEKLGYQFGTTFQEFQSGSQEAFYELNDELRRSDAHHVIVPSLRHFSRNSILQDLMVDRLENDSKAEVHTLKDHELSEH